MSTRELDRVEVMGRVAKKELKLIDAAAMLQLSYRQIKRLWRRYQQKGSKGLQHGNVGRVFNRSKPAKFSAPGVEFDPAEVFGFGSGALRADAGG
jgi:hypothetical protein